MTKKKRVISIMLCLAMFVGICFSDATARRSEAKQDVYRTISTADDFSRFIEELNGGKISFDGKLVVIDRDIQMNPNLANNTIATTIENRKTFNGILDGQGHTVSNIDISGVKYAYLFDVGEKGEVRNLRISGSTFKGSTEAYGLSGHNAGLITNCQVCDCTIGLDEERDSYGDSAGISGGVSGKILNCSSLNNRISGVAHRDYYKNCSGGISSLVEETGTIKNCVNTSSISINREAKRNYNSSVGGISGRMTGKSIVYMCYNAGSFSITNEDDDYGRVQYGGLIGKIEDSSASVSYSFWSSDSCKFPFGESKGVDKACESCGSYEMSTSSFLDKLNVEAERNTDFSEWVMDPVSIYPTPRFPGPSPNPITVTGKTAKMKRNTKKNTKLPISKLLKIENAVGNVTYKKVFGVAGIKVAEDTGMVTIKKGLSKGKYKKKWFHLKISVTAAGAESIKPKTVVVECKVSIY